MTHPLPRACVSALLLIAFTGTTLAATPGVSGGPAPGRRPLFGPGGYFFQKNHAANDFTLYTGQYSGASLDVEPSLTAEDRAAANRVHARSPAHAREVGNFIKDVAKQLDSIEKDLEEWGHGSFSGLELIPLPSGEKHDSLAPGGNRSYAEVLKDVETSVQGGASLLESSSLTTALGLGVKVDPLGAPGQILSQAQSTIARERMESARTEEAAIASVLHQQRLQIENQRLANLVESAASTGEPPLPLGTPGAAGTKENPLFSTPVTTLPDPPAQASTAGTTINTQIPGFDRLVSNPVVVNSNGNNIGFTPAGGLNSVAATAMANTRSISPAEAAAQAKSIAIQERITDIIAHPISIDGDRALYMGLAQVSVSPGSRTRQGYACEVTVRAELIHAGPLHADAEEARIRAEAAAKKARVQSDKNPPEIPVVPPPAAGAIPLEEPPSSPDFSTTANGDPDPAATASSDPEHLSRGRPVALPPNASGVVLPFSTVAPFSASGVELPPTPPKETAPPSDFKKDRSGTPIGGAPTTIVTTTTTNASGTASTTTTTVKDDLGGLLGTGGEGGDRQVSIFGMFPQARSQTLDLAYSKRHQFQLLMSLAMQYAAVGQEANGKAVLDYVKRLEKDVDTRSSLPVLVPNSDGTQVTYRFDPSLQALGDPAADKSKPANILHATSVPVLLALACDKSEVKPNTKLRLRMTTRWVPIQKRHWAKKYMVDWWHKAYANQDARYSDSDILNNAGRLDKVTRLIEDNDGHLVSSGNTNLRNAIHTRYRILEPRVSGNLIDRSMARYWIKEEPPKPAPIPAIINLSPATLSQANTAPHFALRLQNFGDDPREGEFRAYLGGKPADDIDYSTGKDGILIATFSALNPLPEGEVDLLIIRNQPAVAETPTTPGQKAASFTAAAKVKIQALKPSPKPEADLAGKEATPATGHLYATTSLFVKGVSLAKADGTVAVKAVTVSGRDCAFEVISPTLMKVSVPAWGAKPTPVPTGAAATAAKIEDVITFTDGKTITTTSNKVAFLPTDITDPPAPPSVPVRTPPPTATATATATGTVP